MRASKFTLACAKGYSVLPSTGGDEIKAAYGTGLTSRTNIQDGLNAVYFGMNFVQFLPFFAAAYGLYGMNRRPSSPDRESLQIAE